MKIGALHKTTLIDFPGKIAAILFTQGCNFRCPYCHNPALVKGNDTPLPLADVMDFLHKRRSVLQGVVITGGEPCLHPDLPELCADLRALGYAVKLDTNGSKPEVLEKLLISGLLDYIAMDIKSDPAAYPPSLSPSPLGDALERSLRLLRDSGVEHEFRLTCVHPFVNEEIFQPILRALPGRARLYLQPARLEGVLTPSFFPNQGGALTNDEIASLRDTATARGLDCVIR